MVDRDEAFKVADGMRRAGRRPSVRKVRGALLDAKLPGGSPRRMVEILDDWREERGLSAFEADTGIPAHVQVRIDAVTATLWEAARNRADAAWLGERHRLQAELRDAERLLAATRAMLADAENRVQGLVLEKEELTKRIGEAAVHQDRRAGEFWDRVAWTVGRLLTDREPMSAGDLLPLLPPDLRREWPFHGEPFTASALNKKLVERGRRGRYVAPADGKRWRCCPNDVEGGPAPDSEIEGRADPGT